MSFFSRGAIIAPKEFNRWLIVPAALAIHLSVGQVYGFSVFKERVHGRRCRSIHPERGLLIGDLSSITIVQLFLYGYRARKVAQSLETR